MGGGSEGAAFGQSQAWGYRWPRPPLPTASASEAPPPSILQFSSTPSDTTVSDRVTVEYRIYSTAIQDSHWSERASHVIKNSAARLVTRIDRRHHIKPVLQQLHWLPVEQRIHYKVLLQVYRALNGLAPAYIAELLQEHVPCRELRSASQSFGCTTIPHDVRRQELPQGRSPALELSASQRAAVPIPSRF